MTMRLIQKTIDVGEIESKYPIVSVNENYIKIFKRLVPKTIGDAISILYHIVKLLEGEIVEDLKDIFWNNYFYSYICLDFTIYFAL
mgnify:CR=1 FL=1